MNPLPAVASRSLWTAAAAALLVVALAALLMPVAHARTPVGPGGTQPRAADPCVVDKGYVWAHLGACGWAGPGNTGPRASRCPGGELTPRGSDYETTIHIRKAGAEIECQVIKGCLSVEAPDVVVRDVVIACTSGRTGEGANGTGVIKVENGASADLRRVRINGQRGVHACVWHQGTELVVARMNCRGVNDGVFSWSDTGYSDTTGDNFQVLHSYFHDFTARTANGHIDGYQTEGARHGVIRHNTFLMTSDDEDSTDSAVAIWNGIRSSADISVTRNLIAGGGFAVYAEDYSPSEASPAGGNSVTNVRFADNVFSTHLFGCVGYWGVWYPRGKPTDGWDRSGNTVLETRQGVDAGNPTFQGRVCS